jgi:Tfp pilus assembly protein PilO
MAESSKTTPVLLLLIALVIGYAGWSGDGISMIGLHGIHERVDRADSAAAVLDTVRAQIDTANRDLAHESVDDLKRRITAYQAQLSVLRSLVPESRELPDLLDDISQRAKARGVSLSSAITPHLGVVGPGSFDTYSYQMSVIGHYHNIGRFLTDVASLRRIIVPTNLSLKLAPSDKARILGDTTAMLEATFTVKTYVKQANEGATPHEK